MRSTNAVDHGSNIPAKSILNPLQGKGIFRGHFDAVAEFLARLLANAVLFTEPQIESVVADALCQLVDDQTRHGALATGNGWYWEILIRQSYVLLIFRTHYNVQPKAKKPSQLI